MPVSLPACLLLCSDNYRLKKPKPNQVWETHAWYRLTGGDKYNGRTVLIAKDDAVYEYYPTKYRNKPYGNPGVGPAIGFVQEDCHGANIKCHFLDEADDSYEYVKKNRLRRAAGKCKFLVDFSDQAPGSNEVRHRLKWVAFVAFTKSGVHVRVEAVKQQPSGVDVVNFRKLSKKKRKNTAKKKKTVKEGKKGKEGKEGKEGKQTEAADATVTPPGTAADIPPEIVNVKAHRCFLLPYGCDLLPYGCDLIPYGCDLIPYGS